MIRESEIESYCVQQVQKHGGLCYKWVSPANPGVPDRIVIFPGMAHLVELKAQKGKLREAQKIQKARLANMDFDVVVLRTKAQVKLWVELTASISQRGRIN